MAPTRVGASHTLPLVLFLLVHHAVLPARSTPVFPIDHRDVPTASLSLEPLAFIPGSLLDQEDSPTASPSATETLAYLEESPSPSISASQSTDAQQEVPEPTPSYSQSWKASPSSSSSHSNSPSPSQTPWATASPSASSSPSVTSSVSTSPSASSSPSPTSSVSTSPSFSATPSASSAPSPSSSPSATPEGLGASPSPGESFISEVETPSISASPSPSESFIIEVETPSISASPSESLVMQEPPATSSPWTPVVNRTVVSPSLTSAPAASVSPNAQGSTSDGLGQPQGSTPLQGSSSSACFPGNARVTLQSGKTKMMSEVQIGDVVAVGNGRFSPVYFFSHRVARGQFAFVRLHTDSGKQITVSGNHYLLVENQLVAANAITVGNKLRDANSSTEIVTRIEKHIHETGLYNPHTLEDTIVADGIVNSVFTTSAYPPLARMLLSPLKLAYRLGFRRVLERFWDDGKPAMARWVVSGTPTMAYAT